MIEEENVLTKKCPNCGNLVHEEDFFCLNCGALVKSAETETPSINPPEATLKLSSQPPEKPISSAATAKLAIVKGAREGTEFPLTSAQIAIGRSKTGNDLVLNDPEASRNHAVITVENGIYSIKDLQSTNGTIVNGRQITSRVLVDGDVIEIGDTVLVFHG
jgi:pSer/pThr/pTyr-binding forkhead associated (FHA) protein